MQRKQRMCFSLFRKVSPPENRKRTEARVKRGKNIDVNSDYDQEDNDLIEEEEQADNRNLR